MLDTPPSTPTRQLFADLTGRISELMSIEARLFRAELSETSSKVLSAAGLGAFGIILALGGLLALLAAAALFLMRLDVAPDVSCLVVAVIAIVGAGALFLAARHFLSTRLGAPRSLKQLSTLRLK
jgi:Putative Actinobacterial Holin-X, holin superfamily III